MWDRHASRQGSRAPKLGPVWPSRPDGRWSVGATSWTAFSGRSPIRAARRSASTDRPGWARPASATSASTSPRPPGGGRCGRWRSVDGGGPVRCRGPPDAGPRARRFAATSRSRCVRQAVRDGPQGARSGRRRGRRPGAAARRRPRLDGSSLTMIDRLLSHGALFCIATVVAGAAGAGDRDPVVARRAGDADRPRRARSARRRHVAARRAGGTARRRRGGRAVAGQPGQRAGAPRARARRPRRTARSSSATACGRRRGAGARRTPPRAGRGRDRRARAPAATCSSGWRCASRSASAGSRPTPASRCWRSSTATG